jgi:hypothetical protein
MLEQLVEAPLVFGPQSPPELLESRLLLAEHDAERGNGSSHRLKAKENPSLPADDRQI